MTAQVSRLALSHRLRGEAREGSRRRNPEGMDAVAGVSAVGYDEVLSHKKGPVAQLGARLNGIQEVTGSIPVRSTILRSRALTPSVSFGSASQIPSRATPSVSFGS